MSLLVLNVIKVTLPAILSFFIGIGITPFLSDFFYKHKLWKKSSRNIDSTSEAKNKISETFKKIHNEEDELKTPRVGGVIIWLSVLISIAFLYINSLVLKNDLSTKLSFLNKNQTILPLFALIISSLIGLFDDFLQIKGGSRGTDGIPRIWRIGVVLLIAGAGAWWFSVKLGNPAIILPFFGFVDLGLLFIPLFILVTLGLFSSSVIDGIDGLAGGVMASALAAYSIISFVNNQINLAAFCAVIVGAILAFLWFNVPPARFYMGETGMLGLTVTLSVVAFLSKQPLLLPIIALPLLITSLSSSIQMFSKKYFKRKVFLIAPLHHHFEALGWSSYKVTMRYWIISVMCALIGIAIALINAGGNPL